MSEWLEGTMGAAPAASLIDEDGAGEYGPESPERRPLWWVVHTRPRCEKKMDQWFALSGCSRCLPLRPSLRIYKSKRVTFEKPLFPGYAFGAFSLLQRAAVFRSDFAANILEVRDQERFLAQLAPIRSALSLGAPLEDHPYLAEGQRVRITTGRFRGIEGIVTRVHNRTRLCLSVDILERSVAFEVDAAMVTPAV
jgi:transcription antitermination factor NusG